MDRIIYTAANGAMRTLEQQAALSNNMANVNTSGFRAQMSMYRAVPIVGAAGQDTRVLTATADSASLFEQGAMTQTGRPMDIAIEGPGWIAVRAADGSEGYTRSGSLHVNPQGQLTTITGQLVLDDGGQPIDIPERGKISFNKLGTINVLGAGDRPRDITALGQIKLVNPDPQTLVRGNDGLFRVKNEQGQVGAAPADPGVRIISKTLEGSNVNSAQVMVGLIENARRFEMQMKIISDANQNEQKANSILGAAQ